MATTPNFGWSTPDNTGLVKNGALDIRTLGNAIDTTMATMTPKSVFTAKGSIAAATAASTPANVSVGANGTVLTADSTAAAGVTWTTPSSGSVNVAGKNGVINGAMDIWQRGTSSSGNAYIADRWYSALISGTGTFAQETSVIPTGGLYAMKFTASAIAQPAIYQAVEQLNTTQFAGKTVTVSALVAASTSVPMTIDVQHSSTADNSVTGTWTSITATSGGTATPTSTTYVSISGVYAIPSTAKSLRVRLFTTSTIANTVVVYFDNIQLEVGSSATAFSRAAGNIQGELAACQRYYFQTFVTSASESANKVSTYSDANYTQGTRWPVQMRIAPTVVVWSSNGPTSNRIRQISTNVNYTPAAVIDIGVNGFNVITGIAQSNMMDWHYTASAEL